MTLKDLPTDAAEDRAVKAVLRCMHIKLMYESMGRSLRCGLCRMGYAVVTGTAPDGSPRFVSSGYVEHCDGRT